MDDDFRPQPKPQREGKKKRQRLGSSPKRELLKLIYRYARAAYLAGLAAGQGRRGRKPLCERCLKNVTGTIHHPAGREGWKLVDPKNLTAPCDPCHRWIHDNPAAAYKEGWLVKRNAP